MSHQCDTPDSEICQRARELRHEAGRALHALDTSQSHKLAIEALVLATSISCLRCMAGCHNVLGRIYNRRCEFDTSEEHYHRALTLARLDGNVEIEAIVQTNLGNLSDAKGDSVSGERYYREAVVLNEQAGRWRGVGTALVNLSALLIDQGRLQEAMPMLKRALSLREHLEPRLLAGAYGYLCDVHCDLGRFETALEYGTLALQIDERHNLQYDSGDLLRCLGRVYRELGRLDEAQDCLERALVIARASGDREFEALTIDDSGSLHLQRGDVSRAESSFREALAILDAIGTQGFAKPGVLRRLGSLLVERRATEEGLHYLLEAYRKAGEIGAEWQLSDITKSLGLAFESQGDTGTALLYHKEHYELELKVRSKHFESHLASMQSEFQVGRARDETKLQRFRAEQLQQQLDLKQRELAAQAMTLARQTEMLGKFRNELRAILRDASKAEIAIRAIQEKLKELPCEAINWTRFEAEFQGTYPDFRDTLMATCPELTKTELRVCALVRLKLISADIASLLCVSERNVESHRYRIRKKLSLTRAQDLYEALTLL